MAKNFRLFDCFEQLVCEKADIPGRTMIYAGDRRRGEAHCIYPFENFEADFCLMTKGAAPGMRNLVDLRIRQVGERVVFVPLSRCLQEIFPLEYHCTTYPYVATAGQLEKVLEELCALFRSVLPDLVALLGGPKRRAIFEETALGINRYTDEELLVEQDGVFVLNPSHDESYAKQLMRYYYVNRMIVRFTPPFVKLYTEGIYDRDRMAQKAGKDSEFLLLAETPAEKIYFTSLQKELYADSRKSGSLKVLPGLFLYLLAGIPLSLVVLLPVYLFAAGYFSSETIASSSLSLDAMSCLVLPALLGGICLFAFDQRLLYRFLYGKKAYKDHIAMMSRAETTVPRIIGCLLTVFLALFTLLHGAQTVRFEENRFADGMDFYSTREIYHNYDEIASVGYVGKGTGETLLFLLDDGSIVDFGGTAYEGQDYPKEKILPILAKKGIEIEGHFDSPDDFMNACGQKNSEGSNETV